MMIIPVILAGGTGSRLWPLSRQLNPKQFVEIATHGGDLSLFQATLHRLQAIDGLAEPIVICNEEHRFLAAEQLRQLAQKGVKLAESARLLLEPEGRNTAPAVTLAALLAQTLYPDQDPLLLVLPADHIMSDAQLLADKVAVGAAQAAQGQLVTFGIRPLAPETGYGYIKAGDSVNQTDTAFVVAQFVEKPDQVTAQRYLDDGGYVWNSGMFLLPAVQWLQELEQFAPAMTAACRAASAALSTDGDFVRVDAAAFAQCPSDSIDYAVMEKTRRAVVVPLPADWSDLGAWSALWETAACRDEADNVMHGDVFCHNVSGSYIHAGSRLVAAVGLRDAVVVETADAVLVADRRQVQDVKKVVQWLEQHKRDEAVSHTLVFRPWGSYESLARGPGFQVKRIRVRPGAALSLQMHHHRAEHWVVLDGEATVQCDDRVFKLSPNESTFIRLGSRHRLKNEGDTWVELIEVQTGAYLGEDDIVRFDDVYGRN